jgi:tRNA(Ile)-lysidine synthase
LGALHVEQVIRLAAEGRNGKRVELPGNIVVTRNSGELTFARAEYTETAQKARARSANETQKGRRAYQYQIQLSADRPTDVSVPELGACFRLKVIDWHSAERETRMWQGLLDLDRLRAPLVLRNWQPGDGYRPRGRRKARKLKEMFLASHVAVAERGRWPVIESCGRVVWAKGMEPAQDFCTTEETRAGVLIEERKL